MANSSSFGRRETDGNPASHNGLQRTIMKGRALWDGGGVVSGRSLAAFIGCGRASTVTGEREWERENSRRKVCSSPCVTA